MWCSGLRGVLTTCVGCMWLRSGHVLFSTCSDPFKGYKVIFWQPVLVYRSRIFTSTLFSTMGSLYLGVLFDKDALTPEPSISKS